MEATQERLVVTSQLFHVLGLLLVGKGGNHFARFVSHNLGIATFQRLPTNNSPVGSDFSCETLWWTGLRNAPAVPAGSSGVSASPPISRVSYKCLTGVFTSFQVLFQLLQLFLGIRMGGAQLLQLLTHSGMLLSQDS